MRRRYTRKEWERMKNDPEYLEQEAKKFEEAKQKEKVNRGGVGKLIRGLGSIVAAPFTVLGEVIDEESKKKQAAGGGSRSHSNSSNGQMDFMKSGWFDDDDDKPKGGRGFYW